MSWFSSFFSEKPSNPPSAPEVSEPRLLEIEPPNPNQDSGVQSPSVQTSPPKAPERENLHRNKIIFAAGTLFFAFSLLTTRRALARRRLAANAALLSKTQPPGQSGPPPTINSAFEAFEALNLATLNVLSVSMMVTGGALWYLDVNNINDARRMIRGGVGADGSGRSEQEAEEDIEEWIATVLSRKEQKEEAKARRMNERGKER